MKKILSLFVMCLVADAALALPAMQATSSGRGRASMSNQMGTPRAGVASKNQLSASATLAPGTAVVSSGSEVVEAATVDKSSVKLDDININPTIAPEQVVMPPKDMREKEKMACIRNNIGIGNTFVWASRYSNLDYYASMVEDIDQPENNTCFVKVELKSDDPNIAVSDVPSKYFEMGRNIACGSWADEKTLEKRILDAKKSARTWATVGGAVGGAAIGVGAMELFGNKLIGGAVEGQKGMNEVDRLKSQLAVLKKDNLNEYNNFMSKLRVLKTECNSAVWNGVTDEEKNTACEKYRVIFDMAG